MSAHHLRRCGHSRRPILVAALALALGAGCGDGAPVREPGATPIRIPRAERLARVRRELQVAISAMEGAADARANLLARVVPFLEHPSKASWVDMGDWVASRGELKHAVNWYRPARGRETILALDFELDDHPLHVIRGYSEALARRGIELVVVPVPTRFQVYPERVPGVEVTEPFAGIDSVHERFLLALSVAGVEVNDILPIFLAARYDDSGTTDRRLYHEYDDHWTPRAAVLAAGAIARRLREMPWFEAGPHRAGVDFEVRREQGVWDLHLEHKHLVRLPEPSGPVPVWFERVVNAQGERAHEKDITSPILLLGDSYSRYYAPESSDLVSLLYARTGWRLDGIVLSGNASKGVWEAVARRRDGLAGKRVVVWVLTAKAFANPDLRVAVPLFSD